MTDRPNPGSDEAIAKGCTCPVLDNGHGKGAYGIPGIFYYTVGCPLHHPSTVAYPKHMQGNNSPVRKLEDDA